jgi:hypothetical protein
MRDYLVQVTFQTVVSGQDGISDEKLIEHTLPKIKDSILGKIGNGELAENIDWIRPDGEIDNSIWY